MRIAMRAMPASAVCVCVCVCVFQERRVLQAKKKMEKCLKDALEDCHESDACERWLR